MSDLTALQFPDGTQIPVSMPSNYIKLVYDVVINLDTSQLIDDTVNITDNLRDQNFTLETLTSHYPQYFNVKKDELFKQNNNTVNIFDELLPPVTDQCRFCTAAATVVPSLQMILLKQKLNNDLVNVDSKKLVNVKKIITKQGPSKIFIDYMTRRFSEKYLSSSFLCDGGYNIFPGLVIALNGAPLEFEYSYPRILEMNNINDFYDEYQKYKNDNTYVINDNVSNMIKEAYAKMINPPDSYIMNSAKQLFNNIKITSVVNPYSDYFETDASNITVKTEVTNVVDMTINILPVSTDTSDNKPTPDSESIHTVVTTGPNTNSSNVNTHTKVTNTVTETDVTNTTVTDNSTVVVQTNTVAGQNNTTTNTTTTTTINTNEIKYDGDKLITYIKNMVDKKVPIMLWCSYFNTFFKADNSFDWSSFSSILENKDFLIDKPLYGFNYISKVQTIQGSNNVYLYCDETKDFNTLVTQSDNLTVTLSSDYSGVLNSGKYNIIQVYSNKLLVSTNGPTNFTKNISEKIKPNTVYVNVDGLGGICPVIVGYDDNKRAVYIRQSWGTQWGINGHAWLSYDFLTAGLGNDIFWQTMYTIE
jgi:hypothetical protein